MRQAELAQWMAGFYDAEGHSRVRISPYDETAIGYGLSPELKVNQRYIAGLFDGDGSMMVRVHENESEGGLGYKVGPMSDVAVAKHDPFIDRLESFSENMGLNYNINIYDSEDCQKQTVHWRIYERDSLRRLVPVLREYCVIKKPQLEIFGDEILPRLTEGTHSTRRGFLEVMAWKDIMDAYKGGQRGKYNLRFFEELWDMKLDKEHAGIPDGWLPDYSRPQRPDIE